MRSVHRFRSPPWCYRLIVLALSYGLLELGAYLGSVWLTGSWTPRAVWSVERAALLEESAETDEPGTSKKRAETLHPYLGYLPEIQRGRGRKDVVGLADTNFYQPDSPAFAAEPEDVVVAVTGGSVAGHFISEGFTRFRRTLRQEPKYRGRRIVVVGLAIGGYKQPQQLMAVTYALALGARFDVVINLDGFNEVALHAAGNGVRGVYPSYPRNWYFRAGQLNDAGTLQRLGAVALTEQRRREWARSAERGWWAFSSFAQLSWHARDHALLRQLVTEEAQVRDYRPRRSRVARTGPRVAFESETELYTHMVDVWADSSRQLDRLCTANGIRYFHFLQPNQYVAGSKVLTSQELEVAYNESHNYREGAVIGYPLMRERGAELAREGIAFSDLTQLFVDVDESLYVDDCCHLNQLGNELLGEAMGEAVLR